ncbi:MAG TPA: DICT sensory domain-containing protein [Marmoricola sp.]|nr:DICT sensory domain-containing protein [Marmoricola sp.]
MNHSEVNAQVLEPDLTIGDLATETGLTPAVLRMWETRHGFPKPHRLPSGHRRYTREDADLVRQVLRRRDAGIRLDVAIAEAVGTTAPSAPSVFAEIRRRHPALGPHRLRKSTLLAVSWALEDEFCARADRPVLFGAFQEERFYRAAAPRWRELARVARSTMVLGDFEAPEEFPRGGPIPVPLPADAPMRREWTVVCDAPDLSACLTAWELPGQTAVADRDRLFESLWTVDPRAVRDAARVCARVAQTAGVPEAQALLHHLADEPPAVMTDIAGATVLMNRVVAYVDRLSH